MYENNAQQLVVGCLSATAAVAAASTLADGEVPGMRLVVGLAFTGMGLATVAMVAPELAGGLSVLILTTTVFVYGEPLMNAVTSFTTGGTTGAAAVTPTQKGSVSV